MNDITHHHGNRAFKAELYLLFSSTESTVFFPQASFAVEEDIGELLIPVRRRGDVSEDLMVVCHTQQGATYTYAFFCPS